MRGDETIEMSKRAGEIVTLDEIIDEVGVDAARFFFVMLSPESPLTFDLELAVEKDSENPVYYVQYGHARIASVLRRAGGDDVSAARSTASLAALVHATELALARRLAEFPRVVAGVVDASRAAPSGALRARRRSRFPLSSTPSARFSTDDRDVRLARLALCLAAKIVLARTLALVGVGAPDSM